MVHRPWTVFGEFKLNFSDEAGWQSWFRAAVRHHDELADAAGVYIIATPWSRRDRNIRYVGMTHNQGFAQETFSQRNLGLIWTPLLNEGHRQVFMWLIAKPNEGQKGFCWDARIKRQSLMLETLFIMHAKSADHELLNTSKMRLVDGISVAGIFGSNSDDQSVASSSLAAALYLA
jgi:hypothetical protein